MGTKRTSPIWIIDRNTFQAVVSKAESLADILRLLGLHTGAGNYPSLKKRLLEDGIDTSHIPMGLGSNKGRRVNWTVQAKPLVEVMVPGSSYERSSLKRRLLKENILKNECAICHRLPEWEGKPLVLRLDHINGMSTDNRLENLRLVCPNCDSQLPTFAGRNQRSRQVRKCGLCQTQITSRRGFCLRCVPNPAYKTKINWPDPNTLASMVDTKPVTTVAAELGVSDVAVKAHCKKLGIPLHGRGYWSKQRS